MMPLTQTTAPESPAGAAFDALVLPHLEQLHARALRLERSRRDDARDLVQDTVERALRTHGRLRPGSNVRIWLFTIMLHLFIDRCRRRKHEVLVAPESQCELPAPEEEARPAWEHVSDEALRSAVSALGPGFREIVVLHLAERQSYREIGERMNLPVNTVGTRLLRARKKLRDILVAETAA